MKGIPTEEAYERWAESYGEVVRVEAYLHATSEYVEAARLAGFRLIRTEDLRGAADATDAPPRLLSLQFILSEMQ
jgi:hypothetical protein